LKKYFWNAIKEALKYKGQTLPNPAVGAVITKIYKDKEIFICKEAHKKAGEKHAEVLAIEKAKKILNIPEDKPLGNYGKFNIYVTLEPCSTYGKTPPCALKIAKEKLNKVFFLLWDVNEKNRKGCKEIFKKYKIDYFCYEDYYQDKLLLEGYKLIDDFITLQKYKKPFFILKAALTLDGFIAKSDFKSKWITSLKSRKLVHKIRKQVNAILIGKNTLFYDNPKLTIRYIKSNFQPKALVMINSLEKINLLEKSFLFEKRKEDTFVLTQNIYVEKFFKEKSYQVIFFKSLEDLYEKLIDHKIFSVLVEGGSKIFSFCIEKGIIDKILLFYSPQIFGEGIKFLDKVKIYKKLFYPSYKIIYPDFLVEGYIKNIFNLRLKSD